MSKTDNPAAAPAQADAAPAPAPEPKPAAKAPYLTTRHTDEHGAKGRFLDLTDAEAAALGDLVRKPTSDQLALRRA